MLLSVLLDWFLEEKNFSNKSSTFEGSSHLNIAPDHLTFLLAKYNNSQLQTGIAGPAQYSGIYEIHGCDIKEPQVIYRLTIEEKKIIKGDEILDDFKRGWFD